MKFINIYKNKLLIPTILLFILCMPFTAFCTQDDCVPAWYLLSFGWISVFVSISNATWMANVFLIITWINMNKLNRKNSLIFSILSVITILIFYFQFQDENNLDGLSIKIISVNVGYYIWLASAVTALISSLFIPKNPAAIEAAGIE